MRRLRSTRLFCVLALFLTPGLLFAKADRSRRNDRMLLLRGTISQIDPDRKEVTVRSADKDWQLMIDDGSTLRIGGRTAALADFKKGMRVRVRYTTKDGKHHVAILRTPVVAQTLAVGLRKAAQGIAAQAYDTRGQMQKRLEQTLQDVDERIEDLEDQVSSAIGETRKRLEADLKDLKEKRAAVREQLDRVKSASADMWDRVKTGLQEALNQYQKAYERAHREEKAPPEK